MDGPSSSAQLLLRYSELRESEKHLNFLKKITCNGRTLAQPPAITLLQRVAGKPKAHKVPGEQAGEPGQRERGEAGSAGHAQGGEGDAGGGDGRE
eukprot:CAMPEP_0168322972 /NCGR_PEP_ID=MMETSP0213-20121227/3212_1 /TAXON_ID=151035 /ORGANISM="Euplotes harpa, Strain FSP1.4" /LENGTH=94 /DNA_ID=CAMNT_0008324971 /DNA_START=20 /DNA_END=304 /DNA_ORIENTATION=+